MLNFWKLHRCTKVEEKIKEVKKVKNVSNNKINVFKRDKNVHHVSMTATR